VATGFPLNNATDISAEYDDHVRSSPPYNNTFGCALQAGVPAACRLPRNYRQAAFTLRCRGHWPGATVRL